jgi:excisionase family DNA binding protein
VNSGSERHEEDFMTSEMIAGKLQQTVEWVNSVCRRNPNPMPFHNVGSRRFFLWSEVHAWVMGSPPVRAPEFKQGGGGSPDRSTLLLTTPEAAKRLYISKKTLLKYCQQHRISYHRYNGGFRFRLSDVEQFLLRNYVSATTRKAA